MLAGRFDAAAKVRRIGAPMLVIHGKRDAIVPSAMGVELYLRATGRKRLLLVEGAAHSDAAIVGAGEYQAALERMLAGRPRAGARRRARARAIDWRYLRRDPSSRIDRSLRGTVAARRAALSVPARMPVRPAVALRPRARGRAALSQ